MEEPRTVKRCFAVTAGNSVIVIDRVRIDVSRVRNLHRNEFAVDQLERTGGVSNIGESRVHADDRVPLINSEEPGERTGTDRIINFYDVIAALHEAMKKFFAEI